jgi:hypothetical protein
MSVILLHKTRQAGYPKGWNGVIAACQARDVGTHQRHSVSLGMLVATGN